MTYQKLIRWDKNETPKTASLERIAQAKQLKSYLLFFDQILANYFAQLSNLKQLLSPDNEHRKSYFTQVVKDVKRLG